MWEIIKMMFFWGIFWFWLIIAIRLLFFFAEEKWRNIENEIDEICEKKHKEEIETYKRRIEFLEVWGEDRAKNYHKLLIRYYEVLSFEICWKSVEQWEREDKKVSRKKK